MIQVLHRAIAILAYLAEDPLQPRPLKVIAAHARLNLGTCANILKTLLHHGLVAQEGPRQSYYLGPWIDHVGCKTHYRQGLIRVAEPEIARLAEETGETGVLAVMHQGRRFILCKANGNRILQVRPDFVFSDNIYHSASGRLILAFLPEGAREAIVRQIGLPHRHWPGILSLGQLHRELDRIRRQGMAIRNDQDFVKITDQIHSVAFPVWNGAVVVAAAALMIPAVRFRTGERRRLIHAARDAARRISRGLKACCRNDLLL